MYTWEYMHWHTHTHIDAPAVCSRLRQVFDSTCLQWRPVCVCMHWFRTYTTAFCAATYTLVRMHTHIFAQLQCTRMYARMHVQENIPESFSIVWWFDSSAHLGTFFFFEGMPLKKHRSNMNVCRCRVHALYMCTFIYAWIHIPSYDSCAHASIFIFRCTFVRNVYLC